MHLNVVVLGSLAIVDLTVSEYGKCRPIRVERDLDVLLDVVVDDSKTYVSTVLVKVIAEDKG